MLFIKVYTFEEIVYTFFYTLQLLLSNDFYVIKKPIMHLINLIIINMKNLSRISNQSKISL